ncbi:hypothetical protein [Aeromonas enteropelogenes]|uniref:hypothetical protein n=1 Tax=Aeromonas enteropelogenes TaxID=29489 RepID=UPI003BA34E9B
MDHEFPDYTGSVQFSGYKVDGDHGIKICCKLNGLKSVDYFYDMKAQDRLCFIEFSDLERHKAYVETRQEEISNAKPLNRLTRKDIIKKIGCEIHQELRMKYTDSLSILGRVDRHIKNTPATFECDDEKIIFHIVVPPLTGITEKEKMKDMIRFYEILKDKVKAVIPSQMISDVMIYPVSNINKML